MYVSDLGLVWMGDMLLHGDPSGLMMNPGIETHRNAFYSEAQQTIDELRQQPPLVLHTHTIYI